MGLTQDIGKFLSTMRYERVPADPLIGPLFALMDPHHAQHVAAFIGEVFGGARTYSAEHGGHPAMVHHHVGRALTEGQRHRWASLLLECADEVGVPSDPEFRSAFVAYLEWGSRLHWLGYEIRHLDATFVIHHYIEGGRSFNDSQEELASRSFAGAHCRR